MTNIYFGIIVILICGFGYWLACENYYFERKNLSLFSIILCGCILRIFAGSDLYLHEWDERFHALVAKNILNHPLIPTLYDNPLLPYDYKNWAGNYIWLSKPIFPFWLISASIYFLGTNEIAVRIPSFIISTLAILLTFQIGKNLFSNRIGILAAFLHSVHGLLIEITAGRISSDHVETQFVFFVELAILFSVFAVRKKNILLWTFLAGVSMGIAVLCKWVPALIVLPVWFSLTYFSKKFPLTVVLKNFFILILTAAIICLPWITFILHKYPQEGKWMIRHFLSPYVSVLEEHKGGWWFYLNNIRIVFGEIIYLPLIWFVWNIIRQPFNYQTLAIGIWWIIPFIIFSSGETKRQTYMLIYAPAIFIITSLFFFYCKEKATAFKPKWLIITVMFLLLALPVRYCIERIKPFEKMNRNPVWAKSLRNHKSSEKDVLVGTSHYIEAMFYTHAVAYEKMPSQEEINVLQKKGYVIFACTNDSLQTFERIK